MLQSSVRNRGLNNTIGIAVKVSVIVGAMVLLVISCADLTAQGGINRVWAVDDGEKVMHEDLSHWARTSSSNRVWNEIPGTISVFGGRNEIVAFQLIIEAGGSGASNVDVHLDSLAFGENVIKNTGGFGDPYDFVGKRIELFTEHYTNITQRSCWCGDVGGKVKPLPDSEHLGWTPDALVPFEARTNVAHGVGGAPFNISPDRNQGVWVDIYIPKDMPAGVYAGTVTVTEQGAVRYTIPVQLQVYDFTLPDETHLRNHFFFGWPAITSRHNNNYPPGSPGFWNLFHNYSNVFHRHRMDLVYGNVSLPDFAANLGGYYTGMYYTAAYKYDGPGAGVPNGTYSIGTYDQPTGAAAGFGLTESSWQNAANSWEQWFLDNSPRTERFKYMHDEPLLTDATTLDDIRKKATWIRTTNGPGKDLDILCTIYMAPQLYGYINFWQLTGNSSTPFGYVVNNANARRALGEKAGIYNGTRPAFGSILLDAPVAESRVNPWICWKYDVDQYYLWETAFYAHNTNNIWADNYRTEGGGEKWWGDGNYIYTGEDTKFPEDSRGLPGPIATMRMKNYRRGAQDYEYLWLARQAGIPIDAIVNDVVPAAFDDYNGTTYTGQGQQPVWARYGYQFDLARRQLAELLSQGGGVGKVPTGSLTVTPPNLPAGGGLVTLSWSSTDATSATINNGIGTVPVSGSIQVPVTESTVFTLSVTNAFGTSVSNALVTVASAPPTGSFSATPSSLPRGGGYVTLRWSSFNASSVAIDQGVGSVPLNGSIQKYVIETTVYTLTMVNNSGTVLQTVQIDVEGSDGSQGTNVVGNPGFENGDASWSFFTNGAGGLSAASPGYTGARAARINISQAGSNVQLYQTNVPLDPCSNYRLSFTAQSNSGDDVDVVVFKHDSPYTNYGLGWSRMDLRQSWATHIVDFTTVAFATPVADARLQFWLTPYAVAGDEYWFDDIVLFKLSGPVLQGTPVGQSPVAGAVDVQTNPVITWDSVAGAYAYDLELSENSLFITFAFVAYGIDERRYVVPDLKPSTTYYWRVRGRNSQGASLYSQTMSFTTGSGGTAAPGVPPDFVLGQNYPNPFNPTTRIEYGIPEASGVVLKIFDFLGREVKTLVNEPMKGAGRYFVDWDASSLASGVYFYVLTAGNFVEHRKMLLLR